MPFKPGQSGNPGGRPKVAAQVKELAREHGPAAINRLAELVKSRNGMVAVRACEALLDRGYGKPTQAVEMSGPEGGPVRVGIGAELITNPAVAAASSALLRAMAEASDGAPAGEPDAELPPVEQNDDER